MNLFYDAPKELMDHLGSLCNGSLDAQGQAALEAILLEDAAARETYRRYLNLHAALTQQHTAPVFPDKKPPMLDFLGDFMQTGMNFLGKPMAFSILVGVLFPLMGMLMLSAFIYYNGGKESSLAIVTRSYDCRWAEGYSPLTNGAGLNAGESLHLQEGLVELTLASGVNLILEGPIDFELTSPKQVKLDQGKLVASVSEQAIGFSVQTPDATVVDLGTEFGVLVDEDGKNEAEVFVGKIEVQQKTVRGPVELDALEGDKKQNNRKRLNNRKENVELRSTAKRQSAKPPKPTPKPILLTAGQEARFDKKVKQIKVTASDPKSNRFVRKILTASFQQGAKGYHAGQSTFIRNCVRGCGNSPNGCRGVEANESDNTGLNYGDAIRLFTATMTDQDGFLPEQSRGLIAFGDLFGEWPGQVPPDVEILSAKLVLHTVNEFKSESSSSHSLYEVRDAWNETKVTWSNFNNGGQPGKQYRSEVIAEFTPESKNTFYEIDVTASVRRWFRGEPNHGWLLVSNGPVRAHFDSSRARIAKYRPQLVIEYGVRTAR